MNFQDFARNLQNHAKIVFPNKSRDLSPASSAQMMIEFQSFVGDVMSTYLEDRFKNSNMFTAEDPEAVYNLSQFLGYRPQGPSSARGVTNFYLEIPATTGSFGQTTPDMRYAMNFKNVQLQNNNAIIFEALEDVDFRSVDTGSIENIKISRTETTGRPTHYVIRKSAEVIAGQTKTLNITVGSFKKFKEIELSEPNVLDVLSVTDSDGNKWYEVDFLAQEAIYEGVLNTNADSNEVPYLLKVKTVPRRFVRRVNPGTGKTSLIFGSGLATEIGTPFVPNPSDVSLDLKGKLNFSPPSIDPQNFLRTRTLGLAPVDTTLTVTVRTGGGSITNTSEGSLRDIIGKTSEFNSANLNATELNNTLSSFAVANTEPITGGDEPESIREIKENSSALFAAQRRLNAREDYIARCLSLPPKFGKVFRVFASNSCKRQSGGVQIYLIAQNERGQLTTGSTTLKQNLKRYLSLFTRMGQGIDILNGNIINIGVDFNVVVMPGVNKQEARTRCLLKVREHFQIDNWQLNQAIVLDDIRCLLKEVEGVISVSELKIYNKTNVKNGRSYSSTVYDIRSNTKNEIIFCPENAIFEVKFPDFDIKVGAL